LEGDEISIEEELFTAELSLLAVESFATVDESVMSVPEGSLGVVMSVDSESPQAAKKARDRTIDAV
jgi:hypothetical protein